MRQSWSTLPPGFLLELSAEAGGGRRAGIERALRLAIRSRRLPPGTRLPSTRVLAGELQLSRGTVVDAYEQLAAEGYLEVRRGAGAIVASSAALATGKEAAATEEPAHPEHDFSPGNPDLESFPGDLWVRALRRALRQTPARVLGYGDSRGLPTLRRQLAGYLARTRGVDTDPESILVCTGFTQALGVVCRALGGSGMAGIAMEDPCLAQHREIVASAGLAIQPLPVDEHGARISELAAATASVVLLTPAHQVGLGVTLSPPRRRELLNWADTTGGYIVEDDYDSEFRYDRQPLGALQGLDRERVIYAGTTSKTLVPGVRLAWLAVPVQLMPAMVEAKSLADRHSSALDQLALAEMMARGDFERHLRRRREAYRRRRDRLLTTLAGSDPRLRPRGIAAGLHALVNLPVPGPTEEEAISFLARRSVAVEGLGPYWHERAAPPQALILNYARPSDRAFPVALEALSQGLTELLRR